MKACDESLGSKVYSIYLYRFPNGKVYVGMTHNTIEKRRDQGYQHNPSLKNAIKKYGWKGFSHEYIKRGLDRKEAENEEIKYIKELKADDPRYGYNISHGGRNTFCGLKHSEETKEKIRKANTGKKFDEQHLKNLSISHKGKNTGEKHFRSKRVYQYSIDGELINSYVNILEASRKTGVNRSCISDCANHKQKTSHGYVWSFTKGGGVGEAFRQY